MAWAYDLRLTACQQKKGQLSHSNGSRIKKVKMILSYNNNYTIQCENYSFKCNAELWFVLIDAHTF